MKITVDKALLNRLENLAKLKFDEQERSVIATELDKILTMFDKLSELDTSDVEPLMHITDEVVPLRQDIPQQEISQEQALSNAPAQDGNFFQVPKFVEA